MKSYKKGSFGEKLDRLIKEANVSKNAFISRVGMSKSYLFDLLSDRTLPSEEMQLKIANALGLDANKRSDFFDFVAKKKKSIPVDIAVLLKKDPDFLEYVRKYKKAGVK